MKTGTKGIRQLSQKSNRIGGIASEKPNRKTARQNSAVHCNTGPSSQTSHTQGQSHPVAPSCSQRNLRQRKEFHSPPVHSPAPLIHQKANEMAIYPTKSHLISLKFLKNYPGDHHLGFRVLRSEFRVQQRSALQIPRGGF
jgi:hypothetical protein